MLCWVPQLCPILCDPMDCSPPGTCVHGDSPGKNTRVGCHFLLQGLFPTQGSNPGLPHFRRILYHLSHQGSPRILEWLAYPFSKESSQTRNWTRSLALQADSLPAELLGKPGAPLSGVKFQFCQWLAMWSWQVSALTYKMGIIIGSTSQAIYENLMSLCKTLLCFVDIC